MRGPDVARRSVCSPSTRTFTWLPPTSTAKTPAAERGSDIEAGVLEVEIALDKVHDVVVDSPLTPQLDDRSALGVEQLAAQPLVVLRPLLDRAVVLGVEARREAALAETVQAPH